MATAAEFTPPSIAGQWERVLARPVAVRYCRKYSSLMDHPCHKCAQAVEDGVPFCSHCGAPQIRVALPEVASLVVTASSSAPSVVVSDVPRMAAIQLPMRWAQALRSCSAAAMIAVAAMFLGLAPPAALPGAGFLAVAFYRRRHPGTVVRAGLGARLGAASGLFCSMFLGIALGIAATVPEIRAKLHEQMLEAMQKAASRGGDVEVLKTPEGLVMLMMVGVVVFILLATLGGALGGALLGRRDRP